MANYVKASSNSFLSKAIFVCEPSYLVGEVLTCVCPNPR